MEGTVPTEEEDAEACQKKCDQTPGCFHFSFWKKLKVCHIQDAFALRRDYQSDFVSGPFQCWSYLRHAGLVRVGVEQFLPKQFNCMQVGVSWEPVMQWRSGKVLAGTQADQIQGCQSLCARTKGCKHFTMEVSMRTCKLAGGDAVPLPGVFNTISGPPVCTANPHTFMRKFTVGQVQRSWSYSTLAGSLAVGFVVVCSSAALYSRRPWRTEQASSRSLVEVGAEMPE
jgi:hypothetical protein